MKRHTSSGLNRRASRRLPSKHGVRATCRKGALDLGPNLARAVLDISETGLSLVVSATLDPGQEVSVTLDATTGGKPVKRLGNVVWSAAADEGAWRVGIRLDKPLRGSELHHISRP
jgi:hypothetical protein